MTKEFSIIIFINTIFIINDFWYDGQGQNNGILQDERHQAGALRTRVRTIECLSVETET